MGPASTAAGQFETGRTAVGLLAEHGFSALVTVRRGDRETVLLFDTGLSPSGLVTNADRLAVDLGSLQGVVLSHGHFDHAGGLGGLAGRLGTRRMPMVVHPHAWTRRRLRTPQSTFDMPTLSRKALDAEGFEVVERSLPSLLVDGSVLITGEVDRTTDSEHGMPAAHQALRGDHWEHDPRVVDDQALVVHLRDRGLVVLTGCGHAGVVNIVRHARRLTGVRQLHALLGGFHLTGPAFEPSSLPRSARSGTSPRGWSPPGTAPAGGRNTPSPRRCPTRGPPAAAAPRIASSRPEPPPDDGEGERRRTARVSHNRGRAGRPLRNGAHPGPWTPAPHGSAAHRRRDPGPPHLDEG
ncbi:MBL fold metallo-hydrolase [Streptomyces sp. PA03-3a]|nr:MBL fold metallo-hydrolase [Streptomyces sp. PA03-3a]